MHLPLLHRASEHEPQVAPLIFSAPLVTYVSLYFAALLTLVDEEPLTIGTAVKDYRSAGGCHANNQ